MLSSFGGFTRCDCLLLVGLSLVVCCWLVLDCTYEFAEFAGLVGLCIVVSRFCLGFVCWRRWFSAQWLFSDGFRWVWWFVSWFVFVGFVADVVSCYNFLGFDFYVVGAA